MITANHTMEGLSRAYLSAVTFKAGANLWLGGSFDYGVDACIKEVQVFGDERLEMGAVIPVQLKATKNWRTVESEIAYDCESGAYNRLVRQNKTYNEGRATTPTVLVLLCLPPDEQDWINLTEEQILLRRCCYWAIVEGELTQNAQSQVVRIPKSQRLTPEAIGELVSRFGVR